MNKQAEQIEAMAAKAAGEELNPGRPCGAPRPSATRALDRAARLVQPLNRDTVFNPQKSTQCAGFAGCRAEKMHQPVFHRGSFYPRCCPARGPTETGAATESPTSPLPPSEDWWLLHSRSERHGKAPRSGRLWVGDPARTTNGIAATDGVGAGQSGYRRGLVGSNDAHCEFKQGLR